MNHRTSRALPLGGDDCCVSLDEPRKKTVVSHHHNNAKGEGWSDVGLLVFLMVCYICTIAGMMMFFLHFALGIVPSPIHILYALVT